MKALKMLYIDKKWIEEQCDISKMPIERVQKTIKDLVEIDEAISELEALQQRKSCEGCKHMNNPLTGYKCKICFRLEVPFKDRYEAKDEQ